GAMAYGSAPVPTDPLGLSWPARYRAGRADRVMLLLPPQDNRAEGIGGGSEPKGAQRHPTTIALAARVLAHRSVKPDRRGYPPLPPRSGQGHPRAAPRRGSGTSYPGRDPDR